MPKSNSNVRNQAAAAAGDLRELLREAELALSDAGVQASDKVVELRERLRSAYAESRDTVKHLTAAARRQAARADEMIHDNPYAAIGVATGVGLLIGCLITRGCCSGRR